MMPLYQVALLWKNLIADNCGEAAGQEKTEHKVSCYHMMIILDAGDYSYLLRTYLHIITEVTILTMMNDHQ